MVPIEGKKEKFFLFCRCGGLSIQKTLPSFPRKAVRGLI
jgi:hypothetical protein